MSTPDISDRRFTPGSPCPVCGGDQAQASGSGERCYGYWLPGRDRVVCTNEESDQPADDAQGWYHDAIAGPTIRLTSATRTRRTSAGRKALVARYDYCDEAGAVLFRTVRYKPKSFGQQRPDPDNAGQWIDNLEGVRRVPFHLPQLIEGIARGADVWIVDGEKDVLAVEAEGGIATCSPMGMERWDDAWGELFPVGHTVIVAQDKDDGAGRRGAAKVSLSLLRRGVDATVVEAAEGKDISDHLGAGHALDKAVVIEPSSAADVHTRRVDWLWKGRLALGKLTVMDGAPGLFKSGMTLDIAARITTGGPMPDGYDNGLGPRTVIVITAEDDWEDTVAPRMIAADTDMTYVYPLHDLSIPDNMAELEELALRVGAVLVVIDPLVAFVPGKYNLYRDQDSRTALRPLADLARRLEFAAWGLRHVSKMSNIAAKDRGTGSVAIGGAARVNLIVGPDPDAGGRFVLATIKSNLVRKDSVGSLAYSLDQVPVALGDGTTDDYPVIVWEGDIDVAADDLGFTEKQGEGVTFLRDQFGLGGSIDAGVLQKEARELDISWKTVQRAADRLGITRVKADFKAGWTWTWFPQQNMSPSVRFGPHGAKGTAGTKGTGLPRGLKRTEEDTSVGRAVIPLKSQSRRQPKPLINVRLA